jgi:FlaA1/EpsC-like NDP-sugar epimerase
MTLRLGSPDLTDTKIVADIAVFLAVSAAVFLATGLSLRSWRFASAPDIFVISRDALIVVATFMALSFTFTRLTTVPRSVPLITYFIMVTALGGMRVLYRCFEEGNLPFGLKGLLHPGAERLLVYGANAETDAFLRSLQSPRMRSYEAVGIIDDDPASRDRSIRGIKVLGGAADLPRIVDSFAEASIKLTSLVLPANALPRQKLREIVDASAAAGLRAVRLPHTCDLLQKANEAFSFEPIEVTDLLGREPVALRLESIDALIRGRSVVVTGGGGSIGSELCRQLLRREPAKLVILDHSEFHLFNIHRELTAGADHSVVQPVLASIRDKERIHAIFAEAQADLVFHAAAYKHVPLVESNPVEGILTNVVGTANVADAAAEVGAKAMIMVSTDKAVKPSSTMGLSKRIAEAYCQAIDLDCAGRSQGTRFMVVRFGNVLGSSGSVVPIFEQQIRKGGPVTVTDPGMTRYFMTIPEAVELLLQGSAFGCDSKAWLGTILVLDMGEPVPIIDLARRMISLAGLVPEKDIPIAFVGMRDGEKLHEQLFDDNEMLETTDVPGIRIARSQVKSLSQMRAIRDRILHLNSSGDAQAALAMLQDVLSENSQQLAARVDAGLGWVARKPADWPIAEGNMPKLGEAVFNGGLLLASRLGGRRRHKARGNPAAGAVNGQDSPPPHQEHTSVTIAGSPVKRTPQNHVT